jgi:hypothetical protein
MRFSLRSECLWLLGGELEVSILEGGADVATRELRNLFDGAFGLEPAAQERFDFVAAGGLEFEHGEPAAEARLEILEGAVAGAEDDGAGGFVEVVEQSEHPNLRGLGHLVALFKPDGFIVGVEVAVGQAGGNVLDAVEVNLGAVEAGDAEFATAEDVVQEPAREGGFADTWAPVEQDGHGGVFVLARLGDQRFEAACRGGRAEIAVTDEVGGGGGDEFGGSGHRVYDLRFKIYD